MIEKLSRFGEALNGWINTLRATNAKAVVTLFLYVVTEFVWAYCTIRHISIDLAAFGAWLAFLAALGGFSLAQFNTERKTDYGYLDASKRKDTASVTAASDGTVTAAATSTAPAGAQAAQPKPGDLG